MPGERITCLSRLRVGAARHSICPLTGRVGNAWGAIWPDHAPAQLTTLGAWNDVFLVVTPQTRPSERFTAVTSSPEEMSTPRRFAACSAALTRPRGSTLRSLR